MRLREIAQRRRRHRLALEVAARQVFRDVFPELPADARLRARRLRSAGGRDIVSVEVTPRLA
jgi:hypothetical protein